MAKCKKKPNGRTQEKKKEEEDLATPNWSELDADLLRCVFKQLSFISLERAKLVCSWWYYASKGCIPNQNQIPWLILFPLEEYNSYVLYVPEDKEKVYKSRDLGYDFRNNYCLVSCGSWLLMFNPIHDYLYILNPITGESIDLPETLRGLRYHNDDVCCFWIDNITKDYLIVVPGREKFTKKGYKNWHDLPRGFMGCGNVFYNAKNQKLYVHVHKSLNELVRIVDLSGDKACLDGVVSLPEFKFNRHDFRCFFHTGKEYQRKFRFIYSRMIVTLSGDFLMVSCLQDINHKLRNFRIYKINKVDNKWVKMDSLGDEALIYDMGITIMANDSIPGIKRNSIYVGSKYYGSEPFVYDLTTHLKEPLPKCVSSSMLSWKARWFFPC